MHVRAELSRGGIGIAHVAEPMGSHSRLSLMKGTENSVVGREDRRSMQVHVEVPGSVGNTVDVGAAAGAGRVFKFALFNEPGRKTGLMELRVTTTEEDGSNVINV